MRHVQGLLILLTNRKEKETFNGLYCAIASILTYRFLKNVLKYMRLQCVNLSKVTVKRGTRDAVF